MSNFPVPSDEPTCVMAWVQIPLEMLNAIVVLSPKLLISTIDNRSKECSWHTFRLISIWQLLWKPFVYVNNLLLDSIELFGYSCLGNLGVLRCYCLKHPKQGDGLVVNLHVFGRL